MSTGNSPANSIESKMSSGSFSSNASVPSIHIESLHQPHNQAHVPKLAPQDLAPGQGEQLKGLQAGDGAKAMLLKRMGGAGRGSFHSPTDQIVSPCTKKLVQSKKKHYTKGKPMGLARSFQEVQLAQKTDRENQPPQEADVEMADA